jgi:hypothetical protein
MTVPSCWFYERGTMEMHVNFSHFTLFFLISDTLREMILTFQNECIQTIVPVLKQAHASFQEVTCEWLEDILRRN